MKLLRRSRRVWPRVFLACLLALTANLTAAQNVDAESAVALAKAGNCFKCHSIDKAKKAPPYARIALKFKDKPDAENSLYKFITGGSTVRLDDEDERHQAPPTKNEAELRNLIRWILSRGIVAAD